MLQNYSLLRMLSASRTALLRNICMINHHHNVFDICLTFATCEVPRFWPGVCKRQCGWQCQRKMSQKSMKTQNYTPNICAKMCIISIYYLIYPLSCCRKNIHFKESNLNFRTSSDYDGVIGNDSFTKTAFACIWTKNLIIHVLHVIFQFIHHWSDDHIEIGENWISGYLLFVILLTRTILELMIKLCILWGPDPHFVVSNTFTVEWD